MPLILRNVKGAPLTWTEADNNFIYLDGLIAGKQATIGYTPLNAAEKGAASGVAPLGFDSKVPSANMPTADAVAEGSTNKYFTEARVRSSLLTGLVIAGSTIAAGDNVLAAMGKLQNQIDGRALTVHTHAISDVTGLSAAIAAKQDTLVSGSNIKTINGATVLGSGDIVVTGASAIPGGSDTSIQFNDEGQFGGGSALTWSKTTNVLGVNGDLTFFGTSRRIRGDFSNATIASRLMIQSSTTNGITTLEVLPNGTAASSYIAANSAADPTNSPFCSVGCTATAAILASDKRGSGTYQPLALYAGGAERFRIETDGRILSKGGAIGYGVGAGGTVTQITSKSTAVTLNKASGKITTTGHALAADTSVAFNLNNSLIDVGDMLVLQCEFSVYLIVCEPASVAGQIEVRIRNLTSSGRSDVINITYAIIKVALT